MTATLPRPRSAGAVPEASRIEWLPPNWFASVMGTGAIAVCGAGLPFRVAGVHALGLVAWALATAMVIALLVATALHHVHRPATARSYLGHPVLGHFYGTVPMALLVVGAATLLVGRDVVGESAAVATDWALWLAGTVTGIVTLVGVPLVHGRRGVAVDRSFPGRLLPVVPPMVSAATGALLVPHAPTVLRLPLLVTSYACFGLATVASCVVAAGVLRSPTRPVPAALVPVRWVVLGPLGQSVAAVNALAAAAVPLVPDGPAQALRVGGIAFSVPVLVVAGGWIAASLVATGRAARRGLPFGLPWWSFTFPVATVVLGCERLDAQTGNSAFGVVAGVIFAVLVAVWALVLVRTVVHLAAGRLTVRPA